jgi:hypothetical protein
MIVALALGLVLSASQFAADAAKDGPRPAMQKLVEGGDWPRVLGAIRNGAADWIALSPELARGSDAQHGAELTAALAAALPRAPFDVLAVADPRRSPVLGVQAICGAPDGSYSLDAKAAYLAEAREALELLPDVAAIGRAKTVCLRELALVAP